MSDLSTVTYQSLYPVLLFSFISGQKVKAKFYYCVLAGLGEYTGKDLKRAFSVI